MSLRQLFYCLLQPPAITKWPQ